VEVLVVFVRLLVEHSHKCRRGTRSSGLFGGESCSVYRIVQPEQQPKIRPLEKDRGRIILNAACDYVKTRSKLCRTALMWAYGFLCLDAMTNNQRRSPSQGSSIQIPVHCAAVVSEDGNNTKRYDVWSMHLPNLTSPFLP